MKLQREFEVTAAYDNPEHCAEMRWYVAGPKGIIQFVLFTGWYPRIIPTPDKPWQELSVVSHMEPHDYPMPADIGYHSYVPLYEGQNSMDCHKLPGGRCYYDGSRLNTARFFSIMVHEGGEALWKALEKEYAERFAAIEVAI